MNSVQLPFKRPPKGAITTSAMFVMFPANEHPGRDTEYKTQSPATAWAVWSFYTMCRLCGHDWSSNIQKRRKKAVSRPYLRTPVIKMISRARVGEALFERESDSPLIVDICGRNIGGTRFKGVYGVYKEVVKTIKIRVYSTKNGFQWNNFQCSGKQDTLSLTHTLTQISFPFTLARVLLCICSDFTELWGRAIIPQELCLDQLNGRTRILAVMRTHPRS